MTNLIIFYDSHCEFCMRSVNLVKSLDWLKKIELKDARNKKILDEYKLDHKNAIEEVHILDEGKFYAGFFGFRQITWKVSAFWILVPFLYIPGIPFIGKRVYSWISRNRFFFGCRSEACEIHLNHKQKK